MTPDILFGAAGVLLGSVGFYWLNLRPERQRRRRFFNEAMGHDGTDGLPVRKSLFERMDCMQEQLDGATEDIATVRRSLEVPRQRAARSR